MLDGSRPTPTVVDKMQAMCLYIPASDGPDHMMNNFNNSASVRVIPRLHMLCVNCIMSSAQWMVLYLQGLLLFREVWFIGCAPNYVPQDTTRL